MTIISKRAYSNRSATQQYLLGDDAEAAISHAMLDERPGRVPRRVPSADDHIPAVRRSTSQLVSTIYRTQLAHFKAASFAQHKNSTEWIREEQGTHSRFWLSNPPAAAETQKLRREES